MGAPSPSSSPVFPDGLPVPRRYWSIAATILGIMMSVLDSSIANIALPSIAHDFNATKAASIWVINAYQIAILAAILPLATAISAESTAANGCSAESAAAHPTVESAAAHPAMESAAHPAMEPTALGGGCIAGCPQLRH